MTDYILVALITLAGSFVQSASGFGYAIICMALCPMFMPLHTASALEVLTAIVLMMSTAFHLRRHINKKLLFWPLLSSTLAGVLGVAALMTTAETLLRRILGGMLILLSLYFLFFSHRIRLKPTPLSGLAAGLIGGFCGGLLNIGGPPMVAYFMLVTEDKLEYNATLQGYFLTTSATVLLTHLFLGNLTQEALRLSMAGLVGLGLGTWGGIKLFHRLTMVDIKKLVSVLMTAAGLYFLVGG